MKTLIGTACAALSLAVALPALADQSPRSVKTQAAQPPGRTAPAAPAEGSTGAAGTMSGHTMPGHAMPGHGMMSGQGMSIDMNQMMSSCPCCRDATQGKPAKAS